MNVNPVKWLVVVACLATLGLDPKIGAAAESSMGRRLLPLIERHQGDVAVSIKHLTTGEEFHYRSDQAMPTASLIKVAVMLEAYRQAECGELDLDRLVELKATDKTPGSGILTRHFSAGARICLRDAIRLMIAYSDNTATNLVLAEVGLEKVNAERMKELKCPDTQIHAMVFRGETSIDAERSRKFGLGSTTSAEMVSLLGRLHAGKLGDKAATREMLDHLLSCEDDAKLMSGLPDGVRLAHKTGAVTRARTDAGLMFTESGVVAICVLTAANEDRRWTADNAAHRLCGRIARLAHSHFTSGESDGPKKPRAIQLSEGSNGLLVEDLQRTLNTRLPATLGVDGDFGPATRGAVEAWQRKSKLAVTGIVDKETWRSLGELVTADPPSPAPEIVNSQQLPKQPAESLDGPPLVTCKAWLIADRKSGEVLAEHRSDQPLNFASTTKIMTAFLVLRYAEEHPEVLDELVVFSKRADETGGSSARIRAGERLPVKELLYGLLLPSGNDASIALAEQFGARLSESESDEDPVDFFVAAMNRAAAELKMEQTKFFNPHGLTAKGHLSSAADLATLARHALQLKRFRGYVSTRQRGCTLQSVAGYSRNVVWKNTNRLLPIEGYAGVKTGTTSAAGACLVSTGKRGQHELVIVVLGSASSTARYTDTRNLYRWAWRTRQ